MKENNGNWKRVFQKIMIPRYNNSLLAMGNTLQCYGFYLVFIKRIITKQAKPFCQLAKHCINCKFLSRIHNTIQKIITKKLSKKCHTGNFLLNRILMKKRILFLSMPNYTVGFYKAMRVPSLGLSSLSGNPDSAFVEKVIIADLLMVQHNLRNYISRLLKNIHPHIVGLTCMSFQYETAVKIAELIKQYDPNIIIIFGGYHPTLAYELISESEEKKHIDFLIRGEGEEAFNRLIKSLDGKDDISQIPNLSYTLKGQFVHNPRQPILDLENIKLPDRISRITKHYSIFGKPCDVVEASRGCTMQCDFCCMPQMYGRTFRKYPVERVIQDIKNASSKGTKTIFFIDDNIFVNPTHLAELCEQILKKGLQNIHYTIQASVAGIARDPNLVKLMAKAGFKIVFLGIESIKQENVTFFSKDKRVLEETSRAIELLHKKNIIVVGGFILGNPEDDVGSLWDHFDFAQQNNIDVPLFMLLTPFLKTGIRDKIISEGLLKNPDDFSFYDLSHANIRSHKLSSGDLNSLKSKMYGSYNTFHSLMHNNVRKQYPWFFLTLLIDEFPRTAMNALRKIAYENFEFQNYKAGKIREIKRMCRWLLDKNDVIQKQLQASHYIN